MSKSKPHIEYHFTLPARGAAVAGTEPVHDPLYPVGTSWDRVRLDWESRSYGPLQPIKTAWPVYAWPGGYPIFYVTKDGGVLSPEAANENFALTLGDDPQWQIVGQDINYENQNLVCDHSGERIRAAYEWVPSP
jgi:hypothetical protein